MPEIHNKPEFAFRFIRCKGRGGMGDMIGKLDEFSVVKGEEKGSQS